MDSPLNTMRTNNDTTVKLAEEKFAELRNLLKSDWQAVKKEDNISIEKKFYRVQKLPVSKPWAMLVLNQKYYLIMYIMCTILLIV